MGKTWSWTLSAWGLGVIGGGRVNFVVLGVLVHGFYCLYYIRHDLYKYNELMGVIDISKRGGGRIYFIIEDICSRRMVNCAKISGVVRPFGVLLSSKAS